MKIIQTRSARALGALVPTLMLVSPAFAQEAPVQTAPPAPVEQSAPAPAPAPAPAAPVFAPSAPVVQAVPDYTRATPPPVVATDPEASVPRAATRSAAQQPTVRSAPRAAAAPRAVAAAPAPVPVTAPAPVATTSAETPPPATTTAQDTAAAPVAPTNPDAAPAAATSQTTTQSTFAIWPWVVGAGIVLLGLIALLAGRHRRREDVVAYDEPAYQEQTYQEPAAVQPEPIAPVIIPAAAAPLAAAEPQYLRSAPPVTDPVAAPAPAPAEETHIADADQADVDALTDGNPPVANRPWLEFGMRPIRAGTTSDEALVEIELTVGNAGSVAADDVRISTFLFASEPASADEFERLLLEHGADATADPVSIAAGEGTRVDATLVLPKHDLAASFSPVIVADARYRLPDGSEGRTFASFSIGMTQEDGALGAMENNRPSMHEDIEARLYGTPEHV